MNNDNVEPRVRELLDELKPVGSRDAHAAARARARFLAEAVSLRDQPRHNVWTIFQQKEKLAMKFVVSTLVIVGLLFGGSATVSAAQDDLPNQALYQVKLMSEDVDLWFVSDPLQRINMLMQQAQSRFREMELLAAEGIVPPDSVELRAQERIQRALQIAAQLDPAAQPAALQQIQARLRTQEQLMLHLEQGTCSGCVPVLERTREMLQIHLQEIDDGLLEPNSSQDQNQTQNQLRTHQTTEPAGTCATCTPALDGTGLQNGNGSAAPSTPEQQQLQTQQQNQGGGGSPNGNGSGGQGGKP